MKTDNQIYTKKQSFGGILQKKFEKVKSPLQVFKELREYENLKRVRDDEFTRKIERDCSSSEESSPIWRKWKNERWLQK